MACAGGFMSARSNASCLKARSVPVTRVLPTAFARGSDPTSLAESVVLLESRASTAEEIMLRVSLTVSHAAGRGALGLTIALLVLGHSDEARAASCKMSAAQIAAVAVLTSRPVTQNAQGVFVRDGKPMSGELVQDMCETRQFYDLVVAREAAHKTVTPGEIVEYIPNYLTQSEYGRVRDHVKRVLCTATPVTDRVNRALFCGTP
jgi:hypothetical protein